MTNEHSREIELRTTLNLPKNVFDIRPGGIFTWQATVNSRDPITIRAVDKKSHTLVHINKKLVVEITPSLSADKVEELVIKRGNVFIIREI